MSDLPPTDRPQRPSARRRAHSRGRYSDASRIKSEQSSSADLDESDEKTVSTQEEEGATGSAVQRGAQRQKSQPALASNAAPANGALPQMRQLMPLTRPLIRQILLWGSICAGGLIVFSIFTTIFSVNFDATKQQDQQNSNLIATIGCLSLLVSLALPFIAGWRATIREGLGRHGGLAGLVSLVLYALVAQVVTLIVVLVQGQTKLLDGTYLLSTLEGFATQALTSFALGWLGGFYSSWQRKRAQQRQAQSAEAISPSISRE